MVMGLAEKWDICSRTVSVGEYPSAFAHWGNIVAVGLGPSVVLIDAITGSRTSVLSGHTDTTYSLAFSLDGTLLVSGSDDKTVKLWDVQTGGVIKTFCDHTSVICSVSISSDRATIASGSHDGTIYLWDVRTGRRCPIALKHDDRVTAISFSPANPRCLISSSLDRTVRRWDVSGRQIGIPYQEEGPVYHVAHTLDGTRFASCCSEVATIRDSESGGVLAKFKRPRQTGPLHCGCFSPDGRFVACAAFKTICIWDIASPEARLVGRLVGHSEPITFIFFSSSLVSGSLDMSIKFWQGSDLMMDSATPEDTPTPPRPAPIMSVKVFIEDGVVVTGYASGVVKTWDLTTGGCKSSFSTPAKKIQDTHLNGDTLIIVWGEVDTSSSRWVYHIWDVGKGKLRTTYPAPGVLYDIRVSGDGSKIFGLCPGQINALWTQTGKNAGCVKGEALLIDPWDKTIMTHGYKVWIAGSEDMGWDFGGGKVTKFSPRRELRDRVRFGFTKGSDGLVDTVTGRLVLRLPERYLKPDMERRWDGRFLSISFPSGEVVIMDTDGVGTQ